MAQPEALRGFLERAGTLPRGSGFIARFLIAWPASTQGTRSYRVAAAFMSAVERFGLRIRELLDAPLTTHADGGLQPIELALSPPAHAAGGDFAKIRDGLPRRQRTPRAWRRCSICGRVGPAERSTRTRSTPPGPSSAGTSTKPAAISPTTTTTDLVAAIRLDAWLIAEARSSCDHRIPTPRVSQFGPGCVRDAKAMRVALATLAERGRAWLETDGKRRFVVVNPTLASR